MPSGGGGGTPVSAPLPIITPDELRDYMGTTNPGVDAIIEMVCDAATEKAEDYCHRKFRLSVNEARIAYVEWEGYVEYKDIIKTTLTEVAVDTLGDRSFDSILDPTDYELLPHLDRHGDPTPFAQAIRIWPGSSKSLPCGVQIRATSDWGCVNEDGSAPVQARNAALIMGARFFKRKDITLEVMAMPGFSFKRLMDLDQDVVFLLEGLVHGRTKHPVMV